VAASGLLGFLSGGLRVLDWDLPRRHADFRHPAAHGRQLAQARDARRGSHHGLRVDDRRDVSHHPPGTVLAVLLAVSVSQRAAALAEFPLAAAVGSHRHCHLPHGQRDLSVLAADPGYGATGGAYHAVAPRALSHALTRL